MNLSTLGLGSIIAVIVLVADAVLALLGRPPGGPEVATFIGLLAIARLT